jgi:hypothetical protein
VFTVVPDKAVNDPFTEAMWDLYIKDNLNKGVVRPVAEVTLGSAAASIDFTSIAEDWSHLMLALYLRGDTAATTVNLLVRINGDSGGSYDYQRLTGNAGTAGAAEAFGQTSALMGVIPANTAGANVFGGGLILVPHYAQAANQKYLLSFFGYKIGNVSTNLDVAIRSGFWRNANAITQITLLPSAGNFVTGSRATLYGMGGV